MRITKFVDVSAEVDIDIDSEDIAEAMAEDPELLTTALRNVTRILDAISDEQIENLKPAHRKIIQSYLTKQSYRFFLADKGES